MGGKKNNNSNNTGDDNKERKSVSENQTKEEKKVEDILSSHDDISNDRVSDIGMSENDNDDRMSIGNESLVRNYLYSDNNSDNIDLINSNTITNDRNAINNKDKNSDFISLDDDWEHLIPDEKESEIDEDMIVHTGSMKKSPKAKNEKEKSKKEKEKVKKKEEVKNKSKDKKNVKKSDKKKVSDDSKKANKEIDKGLEEADKAMREVEGWNYTPVTKERSKPSKWRRFWDKFASGASRAFKAVTNLITAPFVGIRYAYAKNKLKKAEKKMAAEKNHDMIPGWQGAKFEKKLDKEGQENGADMIEDTRRVPVVWSYPTAGRAVDKDGNLIEPEVTVYIDQPVAGSSKSLAKTEMGHAMIGIHYSRYSKASDRTERFSIKYGFYPAGGTVGMAMAAMQGNNNAIVPGQLNDDKNHKFTISRRYKASMDQVGRILKASETYASKGYGYYKRNCTTFVRDMVVKEAKLDTGGKIFEEETIRFNALNNAMRVGGGLLGSFATATAMSHLADMSKKDDMTYQNFGNKRANAQEVDTFRKSMEKSGFIDDMVNGKKGYIPAVAGENLRRIHNDWDTNGVLGAGDYKGNMGKINSTGTINFKVLYEEIEDEGKVLSYKMQDLLPKDQKVPIELQGFLDGFYSAAKYPLMKANEIVEEHYKKVKPEKDDKGEEKPLVKDPINLMDKDTLVELREKLTECQSDVGKIFTKYFKGDSRLDGQVMKYLSILETGISAFDILYRMGQNETEHGKKLFDDKIDVSVGDYKVEITPSMYEAYLQIYKDPLEAVKNYARLKELQDKKEDERDSDEKKELSRLERINELADEFDASHRYLLDREEYSGQDIDYIYRLAELEKKREDYNPYYLDNASGIYQTRIFNKIFEDLEDKCIKDDKVGGVELAKLSESKDGYERAEMMIPWVDGYLQGTINNKMDLFKKVVSAMKKADPDKTSDEIVNNVWIVIIIGVIGSLKSNYRGHDKDTALEYLNETVNYMYSENKGQFGAFLKEMIEDNKVEVKA